MDTIADELASEVLESIGDRVASLIVDILVTQTSELMALFPKVGEVPNEIRTLSRTVRIIGAYVTDAEEKQSTNRSVKLWLKELKDIVDDAVATIEECITNLQQHLSPSEDQDPPAPLWKKVCRGLWARVSYNCDFYSDNGYKSKIEKINEDIEQILNLGSKLNLNSAAGG